MVCTAISPYLTFLDSPSRACNWKYVHEDTLPFAAPSDKCQYRIMFSPTLYSSHYSLSTVLSLTTAWSHISTAAQEGYFGSFVPKVCTLLPFDTDIIIQSISHACKDRSPKSPLTLVARTAKNSERHLLSFRS